MLLGLDQFQEIAGSLGRSVSDELRYRVANRLSRSVRPADLLARVGGDEFAVLLTQADLTTTRAQAGALMDALRAPFALDHITVQVDASIGVALWPDHCAHPQELLGCAEAAMAHARTMTSHIAVYDAAADLHTNHDGQFIADLRNMLAPDGREAPPADSPHGDGVPDAGMLMCYYQPKIEASDDSVHSVEALVRWRHPARGLLLPDQFLPAAEHAGLMRPVAALVLDMALAQIRSWRDQGITLTVAVNLSTTNLLDLGVVETIARLLRTHDLPAQSLILEITESTLTTDSQRARRTVAALRRLGTLLSLDDYGTGWSSLARLQDLVRRRAQSWTGFSSHGWPAILGPLRSCARRWLSRTALEPTWSPRVSKTTPLCTRCAGTAATSHRAMCTAHRFRRRSFSAGSRLGLPRRQRCVPRAEASD